MRPSAVPVRESRAWLPVLLAFVLALGFLVAEPSTRANAAECPCSIFTASQVPANPSEDDTGAVEVGVKFRADQPGFITGIRFYKGTGNGGTHTGSLWETAGTRLATVTFENETATGWQQATFSSPVAVAANTTYIASYYAPVGRYAADQGYFAGGGVTNAPLSALQDGVDGGNGVYRYGTGGGFPSSSWQASNYWVDVVFSPSGTDTVAPTVVDRQPAPGATGVATNTTAIATFSEPVQASTITMTLTGPGTTAVPASTSYDPNARTATLRPSSSLATSTTYTVSVDGAKDSAGNTMAPVSWTFTTAATASTCPCTIWPSTAVPSTVSTADSSAVELGVKFRAGQNGYITGVRFYKGAGNTGTHVGSLWNRAGTKLASATFVAETAGGWQTATFASPVPVVAGTTYVASYYAPVGRYSSDNDYFATSATVRGPLTALQSGTDGANGVYRYGAGGFPISSYRATNYWVDVVFDTTSTDATAPTVVAQAPAPGSSGAPVSTTVTATFSEDVAGTAVMELRTSEGATVPATVTYSGSTLTSTLTPNAALEHSTGHSVTVRDGRDASGNVMKPVTWSFATSAPPPPPPHQGPGGPVAVVTSTANPYTTYLAEILRTEGLNEFATVDVGALSPAALAAYDVVVLGDVDVTSEHVVALTAWVEEGGNLIAMRPRSALNGLLGLTAASGTTSDAYLKVDAATSAGAGIVTDTMQFHGTADRYIPTGAQVVATLYSTATASTSFPAVTRHSVGTKGGEAAAFAYDLARSVVLQRQGNPAWATQERDGKAPIRSDDKFFGGNVADWVDLSKVAIPQADEQQRLLANLVQVMNRDRKPLPRFWYFPRGLEAVVVGTGDDHGNNGTAGRFDQYAANSPAACTGSGAAAAIADWSCLRFSSYVYPNTPLSDSAARAYTDQGFEVGVHPSTGCSNYTPQSIADTYTSQLASWKSRYPSLPGPATNRLHCIVFSDWASQPKVERANGIRMDTNYYYWPSDWIRNRPGFMTGSGMPMRFADTDGTMLDIYQAMTQMTDESGQTYPFTPNTLLDNALGAPGFYGAFVANMHTDQATIPQNDALIASAVERGVPIVSARQLLTWTDGRNASSFGDVRWEGGRLTFTVRVGEGAHGLTAMLPTAGPGGSQLDTVTLSGGPVALTRSTVKGREYASFTAAAGSYAASYVAATGAPIIQATSVEVVQAGSTKEASVTWTTSEPATSEVAFGTSPGDLSSTARVSGAVVDHQVRLRGLAPGATYYYRVTSRDTTGTVRTVPDLDKPPARFTAPALDRTAPALGEVVVAPMPDGTARFTWTTSEAADSVVRYGRSTRDLDLEHRSGDRVRHHTVVVVDLEPGRTYFARVSSSDAGGNGASGRVVRFVTPARGVTEQATAQFRRGTTTGAARIDPAGLGSVTLSAGGRGRSGTFVSGIMDARAMADWDRAVWMSLTPGGSRLEVSVRTGSTQTADETWSSWTALDRSGHRVRGSSRFLQYRIEMSSPTTASPSLHAIGFTHNGEPVEPPGETP